MNEHEQRIKIAEACGWKRNPAKGYDSYSVKKWLRGNEWCQFLPDYLHDLNACHEMEKVLMARDGGDRMWRERYCHWLSVVCEHPFHATAAQRCEAFLRTLNLWKDNQ